jgi:hypothetical protein
MARNRIPANRIQTQEDRTMGKKTTSGDSTAAKKTGAKKSGAGKSDGRDSPVASLVIAETTETPVAVKSLATPPTVDKPRRIHPRRFPPRIPEGEDREMHSITRAAFAAAAVPSPGEDLAVVLDTELKKPGLQKTASNVGEPSVAINGKVVFYTGNWYAAFSTDGGKTFQFLDPQVAFKQFDPPGSSFCCDQVVQYIPQIDTFVWLMQYGTTSGVDNFQRLAFAKTADVAASRFRIFDITAKGLGAPGAFLDFPDLAVGANFLYMTTNIFPPGTSDVGSAVVRIAINSIATGPILAQRFVSLNQAGFRVAQNCGNTAFFAVHENTSTLRVFSWDEKKGTPTSVTVPVARWIGGNGYQSRTPDNRRWLDRADSRITGGTLAGNHLWFAWSVNRGSNMRDRPFIQIARINATNMTLEENINIFDPSSATAYPALATNGANEVGLSYFVGGGTRFPTLVVALLTNVRHDKEVAASGRGPLAAGDGSHEWGDYLALRPVFPDRKLFASSGYVMKGGGSGDGSNRDCTPHFVIFGRKKDT